MTAALRAPRLLALFALGLALFNFPLLAVWASSLWIGGALLPLALFAGWALVIAVLAWLMERGGGGDGRDDGSGSGAPDGHGSP